MRWPFGRPSTVRTRIVALALAPVVALMALWSFAMVSVTGELRALVRVQGVYESFGTPVDTAIGQIQIERRLAAAYLGAEPRTAAALDLMEQQRRTDRAVAAMREAIRGGDRGALSDRQRQVLDTVLDSVEGIDGLRQRVLSRDISWDRAVAEYSALVEPGFDVQSALTALQAGQLAREAQVVIELVRVREFVSREDALVAGARAAGSLTDPQYDTLTATIEDRRVFERTYVPDLPADSRALFEGFQRADVHRELTRAEDFLLRAGAQRAGEAVAAGSWRTTTDRAVERYMQLCTRAAVNSAERGRAFAYRELAKAAIVGALGLAAVGLSLWFAVRGARRISRRLEALRDAADRLTARQLPDVMRRLSAGEEVDAAAEAPPLADGEAGADEIGQVGRSFNTARLAAVEAAVRQATLRRGLFAVLLNIARRNQALVHRQLKLVDTLERRTDDPDVLDDLFRIDHLTTRMRRHAESLIILSGAAPGRRWRAPVPVADVVSSAVSEIEEYARVVVPPMPDTGIAADAVADVVHLVAELVENATVFSPPHTQVTLRTSRAGGGFVLEIDDRGLGLDPEQMEEAHRTLTTPDDFDPTRHDRLGLYVVGRLAARHGIEVTLCRSPYGGTTAVVLLPRAVLASVEAERPPPDRPELVRGELARPTTAPEGRATERPAAGSGRPTGTTDLVPDRRALPSRTRTAVLPQQRTGEPGEATDTGPEAGQDRVRERERWPGGGREREPGRDGARENPSRDGAREREPGRDGARENPSRDGAREREPGRDGAGEREQWRGAGREPEWRRGSGREPDRRQEAGHGPKAVAAEGAPPLPTRVRQASLAAGLRTEEPASDEAPEREVTPEEMRAVFGAFQRGLDRGRRGLPTDPGSAPRTDTEEGTDADDAP
ncbi:nitrate- and nitrite sensing domain-containing protein [Streptomyces sp. 142MFCol3.1]|uniref:nitrate- and nitrite sensing domain-containing protein n=1 Tax=Streptomyces sp. 142MFCol3.1 TaxID=1172179 RepID=UPI0004122A8F|nr:nitrate- and nitrite sensing domain-containing protein [Streptomyces sp. 142MFCol3.1]